MRKEKSSTKPGSDLALTTLDGPQRAAVEQIILGATMTETAAHVGVDRATLYRWRTSDRAFMQALEAWRNEQCRSSFDRLTGLAATATSVVASAVEGGDARLAMRLLERLGIAAPPKAPDNADVVEIKIGWSVVLMHHGKDAPAVEAVLRTACGLDESQLPTVVTFATEREYDDALASSTLRPSAVTGPLTRPQADRIVHAIEEAGGRARTVQARYVESNEQFPAKKPALIAAMPE